MKVSVVRWAFLACIVIVFTVLSNNHFSYAANKVRSLDFKGEKENKFKTDESVYIRGKKFEPLTNVDIYVTNNRKWKKEDKTLLSDISADGVETVQTTSRGRIPKTMVWGAPIVKGKYDIVVDANQDGTFNNGDAVDGKDEAPGFKVKRFLR